MSRKRELARSLFDISASVKDAATGLLEEESGDAGAEGKIGWAVPRSDTLLYTDPSSVVARANKLRKRMSGKQKGERSNESKDSAALVC
jgi:hypothetical protein